MFTIQTLTNQQAVEMGLVESIIVFDKQNMREIFEKAGVPFPDLKRRKGFETPGETIIARDASGELAGYLQYGPDWNDPNDLFIGSLQIVPFHRKTRLLSYLIKRAIQSLSNQSFHQIVAGVQKSNVEAIRIYEKLGFVKHPNPISESSFRLVLDRAKLPVHLT
jgi:ribosomal protein S18 acetylase RimI-like enzyme